MVDYVPDDSYFLLLFGWVVFFLLSVFFAYLRVSDLSKFCMFFFVISFFGPIVWNLMVFFLRLYLPLFS